MKRVVAFCFFFSVWSVLPSFSRDFEKWQGEVKKLFSKDPKVRLKIWQKLLKEGEKILPWLEAMRGELPPGQAAVIGKLILEIELRRERAKWTFYTPLLSHSLVLRLKQLKEEKRVREIFSWNKEVSYWLQSLAIRDKRSFYLSKLYRQGVLIATPLWKEREERLRGEVSYLAKRLWEIFLPYWKKDWQRFRKEKVPWEILYLIAPFLRWLSHQGSAREKEQVRIFTNRYLPFLLRTFLHHPKSEVRELAGKILFLLKELALPYLLSQSKEAQVQDLLYQIRWNISLKLREQIGDLLRDYERLSPRERRTKLFWLRKIGGEKAIPTFWHILREEPDPYLKSFICQNLILLGDERAARYLQELRRGNLKLLVSYYMEKGIQALERRDFPEAEKMFLHILRFQPKNAVAHYNLACVYSLWNKVHLALEHLEKAIRLGFHDVEHMEKDRDLDNIRSHPKFKQLYDLAKRLGEEAE